MIRTATEPKSVPEEVATEVWRRQLVASNRLVTTQGTPITVIYPGDREGSCGPDFSRAIVHLDGRPVRGDIEIHVRSSDWRTHQHHRDPAYNGVILHVVLWDDSQVPASLQSGGSAPVVELSGLLPGSLEQVHQQLAMPWTADEACFRASRRLTPEAVGRLLGAAGEQRFRLKAALMAEDFPSKGAEQTLYENVMGALGYSRNKQPCLKLARLLPLSALTKLMGGQSPATRIRQLQAWLLGTSGLLVGQCSGQTHPTGKTPQWKELEHLWRQVGGEPAMNRSEWCLSGVRPCNSPLYRLVAASYLLHRYSHSGWLKGIVALITRASLSRKGQPEIETGFVVHGDDGCLFTPESNHLPARPALLGAGRARDIVVNVVLPFGYAWAQDSHDATLAEKALALYHSYRAGGDNRITRQMLHRLWQAETSPMVNSAARQQGLIHLYRTFCTDRKCDLCPLGSLQS